MISQQTVGTTAVKLIEVPSGMVAVVTAMSVYCLVGSTARVLIYPSDTGAATAVPSATANCVYQRNGLAPGDSARPLNEIVGTGGTAIAAVADAQQWELESGAVMYGLASAASALVFTVSFQLRQQVSRAGASIRR